VASTREALKNDLNRGTSFRLVGGFAVAAQLRRQLPNVDAELADLFCRLGEVM